MNPLVISSEMRARPRRALHPAICPFLHRLVALALLAGAAGCLIAQPAVFKLQIPELGELAVDGDVVEVPGPIPQSLSIRVLNPVASDVDYGKIFTKLNGEGAGYITAISSASDGKVARMDLRLRQGMQLLPGTNTIEIQATNRHGRRFYRNFLVKTREDNRNDYFSYETKRAPGDQTGGPEIAIVQPDSPVVLGAKERSKRVLVRGSVSAINSLASLRVAGAELRPDRNAFDFTHEVTLSPADTRIVIEAADQAGNRSTIAIPVSRAGAGQPVKIEGGRYALVIGISQYSARPGLARLPSASLDARDFAVALTEQAGFKKEDVFLLTDDGATHAQVRSALRTFTARPGPDDLLMIFFAGYGLHDPLDPSKIYLAAYDTQLGHVPETAVSVDDLKSTLAAGIRSRQALFLFDVNHPITGEWAIPNNNLVNEYLLRMFPGDTGKAVMVASSVGENSLDEGGGGLFARQVIAAARGQGDANQDGVITIREWFLQVSRAVRVESHGAQNPRFTLQQAEKPVFAMNR